VRSVRLHDLHHTATEYDTTWTGEAEIGAWEIASGCADHGAAWLLNLWAMALGLFINPSAVFRAFVRGRHSSNLYREEFSETLLGETLASLRQRLRLVGTNSPATSTDSVAFAGWSVLALVTLVASALPLVLPLAGLIAWVL
jgi:hypothetical protein